MKLKKELAFFDVFCIATGAMISSGLFILPGLAHERAGTAMVLSYLCAGLLAMTGMFSVIELSTAMPRAGGDYFFITRSMGPAVGTVSGLLSWLALTLKSGFALIGMAAFTQMLVPIDIHIVAIVLCLFFVAVNLVGVKAVGRLQSFLVAGLLILLILYIIRGAGAVDVNLLVPFAPNGATAIFSTAGFVFVSYGGLLKVASISEEIHNPGKNIPLGMIISLLVVSVFYCLVVFITAGTVESATLNKSLTPISDGAHVFMGKPGRIALDIAAILAFISTANAGILSASRYPLALSRDELVPGVFSRINARFKTPHISILTTGGAMIVFLLFPLKILVEAASTVLILTYLLSSLSIIVLRESGVQNYRPQFRAPLYPWPQIIGIIGFCFLIFEMGIESIVISLILIVLGSFSFWFYGRIRATRESALLHLLARITAKELSSRQLESELRDIIKERDDITKDRFDEVVEQCRIIDLDRSPSMEELFQLLADEAAQRLPVKASQIYDLLIQREQESSTVITPFLAIPHIIVDGEKIFDLIIIRCTEGIRFADNPNVRAVCALIGSRDERNFHLRVLSSIAQIVQNPRFEKRWMAAHSIEGLRDLILLGERRRYKNE